LRAVQPAVPPELWNRFGSKIILNLGSAGQLHVGLELAVVVETRALASLEAEVQQILTDLDLGGKVVIEKIPVFMSGRYTSPST
jgi:hypothetical protein